MAVEVLNNGVGYELIDDVDSLSEVDWKFLCIVVEFLFCFFSFLVFDFLVARPEFLVGC